MRKHILVFIALAFSYIQLSAQLLSEENNIVREDSLISEYFRKAGNQAVIYSGKISSGILQNKSIAYLKSRFEEMSANDSQYFLKGERNSYSQGYLFHDGIIYSDITLRLDLMNDELIVLAPDRTSSVIVDHSKLDFAELHGYRVVYLNSNKENKLPSSGYYIQFHKGRFPLYKRYTYPYVTSMQNIKQTITYYIFKDAIYHKIGNKGDLLNVFNDRKKELEQFSKENKLNFNKDKDESFALVVEYYEKLNRE